MYALTVTGRSIGSLARRLGAAAGEFVSRPASPRPLGVLRIGLCSVLLLQALAIAGVATDLFGRGGLMQWALGEAMLVPGVPRLRWLVALLEPFGMGETACVRGVFLLYVAGLTALLVGWRSRPAAVLAYVTHLLLFMGNRGSVYGVDDFAHIALFYCIWFPVGHWGSLDVSAGRVSAAPSAAARLALRVLQIHLCIVYLSSGIEKALTPPYQWLDGDAIWRTTMLPEYRQFELSWLANVPWLVIAVAWGTLALEIGYAVFVWPRATRRLWAVGTIAMHAGIAVFMGLVSFAGVMIVLTTAAFLIPAERSGVKVATSAAAPPRPAP
jgi:HTTM domain